MTEYRIVEITKHGGKRVYDIERRVRSDMAFVPMCYALDSLRQAKRILRDWENDRPAFKRVVWP